MTNTMPPITKVQAKKQALAGIFRLSPEGTFGAWPGDNPNQCSQGYSCPNPVLTIDPYVPFGNRFVDIGAAGPNPFTFNIASNVSWLTVSDVSGHVSSDVPEKRVYFSVDWSKVDSRANATAAVTVNATAEDKTLDLSVGFTLIATHNEVPEDFSGKHLRMLLSSSDIFSRIC